MKFKQAFKDIQKPADIEAGKIDEYLCQLYGNSSFSAEDKSYVDNSNTDSVDPYNERVNLLIDKLVELSGNPKLEQLKAQFNKNVYPGETRITLDEVKKTAEVMCYKLEHGQISSLEKFKAAIENATLTACEEGLFTNMQKILYSMDDSLYVEKYNYIQNLANEYIRTHSLSLNQDLEVHRANELIHEVSQVYNVHPPRDKYARYRDLSSAANEDFIKHVAFKEYINNHFASREGIYNFAEIIANGYLGNLPTIPKDNKKFVAKEVGEDGKLKYTAQFEQINIIADSLNIPSTSIIKYSDDGKEFEYQENYMSVIKVATMQNLMEQGLIEQGLLTSKSNETTVIPARNFKNNKGELKQVSPERVIVNEVINQIIESPDGWVLVEKVGDRIAPGEKLLDTRQLQGLTIEGQDIEDHLHIELSSLLERGIDFKDSLRALIEGNENRVELEQPDLTKELILLSDQGKNLLSIIAEEDIASMSIEDIKNWGKFLTLLKEDSPDTLPYIAQHGDEKMLDKYLESDGRANEDIKNWRDKDNQDTLLHIVFKCDNKILIKKLIELGIDKDAKDRYGRTSLHIAAKLGKTESIAKLIELGVDEEAKDHSGSTALHIAAENGKTESIATLVELGVDKEAVDNNVFTALHIAAENGDTESIAKLIELGVNKDAKDRYGKTALHLAAKNGDTESIAKLIELGVNKEAKNDYGRTALYLAAENGETESIAKLIEWGVDKEAKDRYGKTALHIAAINGETESIAKLIELGVDKAAKDNHGRTSLHLAAEKGDTESIAKLIELGVDKDARDNYGSTALHMAAENVDTESIAKLIELGVDKEAKDRHGRTALHIAAEKGDTESIAKLIALGVDKEAKDRHGRTALHITAEKGDTESIAKLIALGVDKEAKDRHGRTALHIAIDFFKNESIAKLIELGVNKEAEDDYGNKVIHFTALSNNTELIAKLIELGVDKEAKNKNGRTALHLASQMNNNESIAKLIELGVDKEAEDNDGRTALHLASQMNNNESIAKLIELGVDKEAKDRHGRTALHIAAEKGDTESIAKLIALGVDKEAKDRHGRTALHITAEKGDTESIAKLIELGVDTEVKDKEGITARHKFASFCKSELGADKEAKDKNRKTALHRYAELDKIELIDKLIEFGLDTEVKDKFGRTALHIAASCDNVKSIAKLIELGADKDARDKDGKTALHRASRFDNIESAAKLIELGVDIRAKSLKGSESVYRKCKAIASHLTRDKSNQKIGNVITNLLMQSSAHIQDHPMTWGIVEDMVNNISSGNRIEVVSEVLESIENTSKTDRLLSFLPEEERSLVSSKVSPTMWQFVRETMEQIHGNSSIKPIRKFTEAEQKRNTPLASTKEKKQGRGVITR